jgi:tetratricopeptide (TPR) repeat protein
MTPDASRSVLVPAIGWCCIAGAAAGLLWAGVALMRPSSQYYRADAMILQAQAFQQAKAGDRAAAAATFELALQAAEHAYRKTQVLSAIAQAQARTGDQATAARTFEQAIEDALTMGGSEQIGVLGGIAIAQAQIGDGPGARKTVALIHNGPDRDSVLASVGRTQAESGDVMAARETLSLVQYIPPKMEALHAIAVAQAQSGDGVGARETVATIPYELRRVRALKAIAAVHAKAGNRRDALAALDQMFKLADTTRDLELRAEIFGFIAGIQARLGDLDAATRAMGRATQLTSSIRGPKDRERALDRVKKVEAEGRGEIQAEAKGTRDWEIVREQIKASDITGALRTAAAMQDERSKAFALREIAEAQTEAGDLDGARITVALIQGKENVPFFLGIVAFMLFILMAGIHFLQRRPWARLALEISSWAVVLILGFYVIMFFFASGHFGKSSITGVSTIEIACLALLILLRQSSVKKAFAPDHAQEIPQK